MGAVVIAKNNAGSIRMIDQPVQRVHRRRKQTARLPKKILRHAVALLNLGDAFALENINNFLVKMAFRQRRARRRRVCQRTHR